MREDEKWLLQQLYLEDLKKPKHFDLDDLFSPITYKMPRDIIEGQSHYNHKRLWYLMEKFVNKDIADYGTSLATAWLTDKGKAIGRELVGEVNP